MPLSELDQWLDKYATAAYNLGESGVQNIRIGEVLQGAEIEAFRELDFEHSDIRGSIELRQRVALLYPSVEVENVLITAGASEAVLLYFLATFVPGANVVVVIPTFHSLYDVPARLGFEVRTIRMNRADDFAVPVDALAAAVDDRTSAIVICSPNNPTGASCSDPEWRRVLEIADSVDCDVLADEQYRFLPHRGPANPVPGAAGVSPRVVSVASVGKCYGCVGLRVGWLIGRSPIVEACLAAKTLTTHSTFKGSEFLACRVLDRRPEFLERYRAWIVRNIAMLEAVIHTYPDLLDYVRPSAGTVAFPRIRGWPSAYEFAEELVIRSGVLVLPGTVFGEPDSFRLRLAVPPDTFAIAATRLSETLSARRLRYRRSA